METYPICRVWSGTCRGCGGLFVGRTADQRHCNRLCRERRSKGRTTPVLETRRCQQCDEDFTCNSNSTRCYCTEQCAKRRRRTDGRHYRERARKAGVAYEPVRKAKVFARDKWRCGICKRKVSPKLTYPHPMSASLDHMLPMSLGGSHTYANVQCSHLQCNVDKRNAGSGEQLALVG